MFSIYLIYFCFFFHDFFFSFFLSFLSQTFFFFFFPLFFFYRHSTNGSAPAVSRDVPVCLTLPGRSLGVAVVLLSPPHRPSLCVYERHKACSRELELGLCLRCHDGETYTEHSNGMNRCLPCTHCRSGNEPLPLPPAPCWGSGVQTPAPGPPGLIANLVKKGAVHKWANSEFFCAPSHLCV